MHAPLGSQRVEPFDFSEETILLRRQSAIVAAANHRGRSLRGCARISAHACKTCTPWTVTKQARLIAIGIPRETHVVRHLAKNLPGTPFAILSHVVAGLDSGPTTHTLRSEEKRGNSPRSVPSASSENLEFRDLARVERIVRKPTRREVQCVPN